MSDGGTRSDGGTATGPLGTADPSPSGTDSLGDRTRSGLLLLYTVLKKDVTIIIRYPLNFAGALVSMFTIFLLLVEGGRRVGGASFAGTLGGVVVGYTVFMLASFAYQGLASSVTREAQWGTLERLHLSPLGFGRVMIMMALSTIVTSFMYVAIVLPLAMAATGTWLSVDLLTVVPIALLGISTVIGIGFVFGGASVVYKRIQGVFRLLQFGLPVLIAAPVREFPWLRALPIVQANFMLGQAMRDGVRLWEFSPTALATLVATGAAYFLAGYGVFLLFVRRARKKGVLGDY